MTPLEAEIRRIIAVEGPIPVARYMELALSHPEHGYYTMHDPFGARGDFITAPEISQMFGELIGLWAVAVWQLMGSPSPVRLVELGPGRGTLMADALRAGAVASAFRQALTVHLVETSPFLRRRQREVLNEDVGPVVWHDDIASVPDGPLIVIANEFFDALPVNQAVKAGDGWRPRAVTLGDDERLAFTVMPRPMKNFEHLVPEHLHDAEVETIFEWRHDGPATEICRRLRDDGGAALIVDYGHAESSAGETFQAVAGHSYAHPLLSPGLADLTAHVDFAALADVARKQGARVHGPITQRAFLRRLGIEERAHALKARATRDQEADINAALARLTARGPTAMGELFKVIAFADPKLPPLPGFMG